MMTYQQIEALNNGELITTYDLVETEPREPLMGEIRYLIPTMPAPWEPLAALMPLSPARIIFDGKQWRPA